MFINFARKLFEILVSDEFSYIKKNDDRLVYDTGEISLFKDRGSILYIVTIINGEVFTPIKYEALIEGFAGMAGGENRTRIILMNVIANDEGLCLMREEDFLPEKDFYVFSYHVGLENGAIETPEEQPELLGLNAKIKEALSNGGEAYVNGTHLASLESKLSEESALSTKSDNTYLTFFVMAINILLWALMEVFGGSADTWTLISFGALSSSLVVNLHEYYRLFTSMFLHIGLAHLASNCLALYIYGTRVERYFGKLVFIIIYLTSGISGGVATVLFMPNLSAGASGAIFGLLGALLIVSYRTGRSIAALSPYVILLLSVSSIGFGFISPFTNNYAHVAGFLTGAAAGNLLYRRV